jgi:hypothetical protein
MMSAAAAVALMLLLLLLLPPSLLLLLLMSLMILLLPLLLLSPLLLLQVKLLLLPFHLTRKGWPAQTAQDTALLQITLEGLLYGCLAAADVSRADVAVRSNQQRQDRMPHRLRANLLYHC